MFAVLAGAGGGCVGYLVFHLAGRTTPLVWLVHERVPAVGAFALGTVCGAVAAKRVAGRVTGEGCFYAFASLSILAFFAAFGPMVFHVIWGTPIAQCDRSGMNVIACEGRDWSFMQARVRYQRMWGTMDPRVCGSFVANASRSGDAVVGVDTCSVSVPSDWVVSECSHVGLVGYDQCFLCTFRTASGDEHVAAQGFSRDCEFAVAVTAVNFSLLDVTE